MPARRGPGKGPGKGQFKSPETKKLPKKSVSEAGKLQKSKEDLEKADKLKKRKLKEKLDFHKEKKEVTTELESDKALAHLKTAVEKGFLKETTYAKVEKGEMLTEAELHTIFDRIEEIDNIIDKDPDNKYLPKKLVITKKDYIQSIEDKKVRKKTFVKIDDTLDYLYNQSNPNSFNPVDIFSSFFFMLNKNLVTIQENTIDIKRSLEKVEEMEKKDKK